MKWLGWTDGIVWLVIACHVLASCSRTTDFCPCDSADLFDESDQLALHIHDDSLAFYGPGWQNAPLKLRTKSFSCNGNQIKALDTASRFELVFDFTRIDSHHLELISQRDPSHSDTFHLRTAASQTHANWVRLSPLSPVLREKYAWMMMDSTGHISLIGDSTVQGKSTSIPAFSAQQFSYMTRCIDLNAFANRPSQGHCESYEFQLEIRTKAGLYRTEQDGEAMSADLFSLVVTLQDWLLEYERKHEIQH